MISGLSHITLIVKDLNRTTAFLQNIFDAEEIYSSGDKTFSLSKEKFFLIAGLWICIMEGDSLQERTYNHIAFQIQSEEVDEYIERIKALGVELKPERPRVEGEGRSIYFYDFDNHLFELHAGTLEERLKRYHE
ncbi:fosfomycin resistance hydrolase FosX [Listeria monocytogenes]|uniref:fosfomycin resistance hydrolase FosX n=1 Tax=Listeria monocytogenes TaxID=1639 RepID=UPI00087353FB|nr:fosfomycin resistance hydrolase FosX [Listeria monocytogenes]EAC9070978.1 FosX/FosE/FosI family fosfomycin resistance thiol transferase [Listeria monocytogenes]EAC9071089.1 FosX/FosE/FosI family fosfomycin resistance thiol transferase [Listeria monocytogenes]OFF89845.1 FosX/FosE/FosI family fosfomycin resistance thiol transferase [Listeria monocytogenes]